MTTPGALNRPGGLRLGTRLRARTAVTAAKLLALLPPRRIRTVLHLLRRGARPATAAETQRARDAAEAVSLSCAGPRGCLPRSLATTLLCRWSGYWPTWCVGVRIVPPFGAHAWVEADGELVGEQVPATYFSRLITVPPR
ncbi:hypothetical protein GCM10012275_29290 [Longimycelium tulufanense]|uniref:Microcin J25-processing protein McjB C-terminal domain-containing protein n=1 Tax=Longimycelium tulufanense TaxID=907463 RepID=A0A8J3C8J5_9PSEU|nr:lasso peptide biosynthesis B2 protein [Longimycelium tulufanense]GGM56334.1 hypothetical protein GCM10012275_29290 [Longimycelium tulufanense]